VMAQVIRGWKAGRPFDEIESTLRGGPVLLAKDAQAAPLPGGARLTGGPGAATRSSEAPPAQAVR
jgi:hypothetical protein